MVRPSLHRPLLVSAAAALLVVGLAACGSDDDDTSTGGRDDAGVTTTAAPAGDDYGGGGTSGGDGGAAAAGTIVAEDFSLTDITVAPGDELVFENKGSAAHTATADDGDFDLGQVAGGETSEPVTAPEEPGSYPFHCEIHPNMTATLTVEG